MAMALVYGTCATVAASADAAGAGGADPGSTVDPATYSFITQPTDQLGVPGYGAGSELTPSLGIDTGQAEVAWSAGPAGRPVSVQAATQEGGVPVLHARFDRAAVRYTLTVFSSAVGGQPVNVVTVDMTDTGSRPADAAWGSDLVYQGGGLLGNGAHAFRFPTTVPEDLSWSYAHVGTTVTRSGQILERVPAGGSGTGAQVRWRRRLAPGASWSLSFAIPTAPVSPGSRAALALATAAPGRLLGRVRGFWHHFLAGAMAISLPESKVTDTFYASLATLEQSRYPAPGGQPGWVQTPNKLQYNAFYIRDAAFIARAFDLVGLHRAAAEDLDYFPSVESAAGLFESQPDELDGQGEALWAIGQHALWPGAGAVSFARAMLPAVSRGVAWLAGATAVTADGLLPASDVDDNELAAGELTGDDLLAADGLASAIRLADLAGRPDLATTWRDQLAAFNSHLRAALATAEARTGGWIPPVLNTAGGQTWGNLWMTYPLATTLSPGDAAVTATLHHVTASFRQGIATYKGMLHDYLGFRALETELQRGEQAKVIAGLYAELAHTTATGGGFETDVPVRGGRSPLTNLAPHGWFAAEYVTLLRNMLVTETGAHTVSIMSAVSPDWLQPGRVISVQHAATAFGRISYRLVSVPGGARLRWTSHLAPGTRLVWPLPAATGQHRTLTLSGARGSITVAWHLHGAVPSFTRAAAAILALYRHR